MLSRNERMLEEKTKGLISDTEKVLTKVLKQFNVNVFDGLNGFTELSAEQIGLIQDSIKIYQGLKDLAMAQAKSIDELHNRIDAWVDANVEMARNLEQLTIDLKEMREDGKLVLVKEVKEEN